MENKKPVKNTKKVASIATPKEATKSKKQKPQIEEFTLPIKKRKIFKKKAPKIRTIFGFRTGQKVQMNEKGKPVIPFKRKVANIIKGRKYDKDGVEVQETLKSRLMKFAKKRGKKTVKKQFKKQIKNWWGSLQGVSKVAVISIGGVGITAAVAVPTVLANTIFKADKYNVNISDSVKDKVTLTKEDLDKNGNLVYSVTSNNADFVVSEITSVKKGDYTLARDKSITTTDFEKGKHEYTFQLNANEATGGKLIIDKNVIGTHKGDIVITPALDEVDKVKNISVKDGTGTRAFSVGERFSSSGLKLDAELEDGTHKEITSGFTTDLDSKTFAMSDVSNSSAVNVSYKGKVCSYTISVGFELDTEHAFMLPEEQSVYKYTPIKGTNQCMVSYSGTGTLVSGTTIEAGVEKVSTEEPGKTYKIIGILTDGFKNVTFTGGEADRGTLVLSGTFDYIGSGAFNNSNIIGVDTSNGDFAKIVWKIKSDDGNEYLSFNHSTITPADNANLFKNDYSTFTLINSYGYDISGDIIQKMIALTIDAEYIKNLFKLSIPSCVIVDGKKCAVTTFSLVSSGKSSPSLDNLSELTVPFTVKSLNGDVIKGINKLKKAYFSICDGWTMNDRSGSTIEIDYSILKDPDSAAKFINEHDTPMDISVDEQNEIAYDCDPIEPEPAPEEYRKCRVYHKCSEGECLMKKNIYIPSFHNEYDSALGSVTYEVNGLYYNNSGTGAFQGCNKLEAIVLPATLASTALTTDCFKGCTSLQNIYFCGTSDECMALIGGAKKGWNDGCPATTIHCIDGDHAI